MRDPKTFCSGPLAWKLREQWRLEYRWTQRQALDTIETGDEVSIVVWPSRQLDNVGYFVQATLADGSIFRDCGFREFREAVVNSREFSCAEAEARP